MGTIGQALKDARNKKAVSHEDVYAKIKIHPRILQLLEEEKFEKLPSPLFAKSFLKSYGDFLGVDSDELSKNYDKEKKSLEPEQVLYLKPVNEPTTKSVTPQKIAIAATALLLVLIVLFGVPSKVMEAIRTYWVKPSAAKKDTVVKKANVDKAKKETLVKKNDPAPASEDPKASEWLNTAKLGNFPGINKKNQLDLQIKALDAVWVHVTCDGKVLFQGILKKGSADTWKAKEIIEVWTGNASNMEMMINNFALGSPGKGVAKKMTISHEGVRIIL